ncbi:reverse transcriptase family protein [Delftia acidovorans]|uniref:reverse transcriptase family protein n=1 Tax=Delftia acidovorans TaxID=80866 RepID=UPI0028E443E1|nr:reverse transcriptase family protein [Delftia acidovorans]
METDVHHTPRLNPEKASKGAIATIGALCSALNITRSEIRHALSLSASERYQEQIIPKTNGADRTVNNPHHLIRKIQRRINKRIFSNPHVILWPDHVFGSIPNDDLSISPAADKDYVNCARQHCSSKSILSVDIKDFFDNIHKKRVKEIFSEFLKFGPEVSEVLANLCCREDHVVQGALTSSYIATLCLYSNEGLIVEKLRHKGLRYTRLVDDITISSPIAQYDFSFALRQVERMLDEVGLPLNTNKTKIQNAGMKPLIVHGLRVDFNQPRLPPDEPRRIRAAVKNLELLASTPGYRASRAYRRDFNRCLGRVNKLDRVGHVQHKTLLERLRRILPLPSHKDIERAEQQVARLQKDSVKTGYQDTYWFHKRWHVASQRLGILKRSFPNKALELRVKLRVLYPKSRYE